MVLVKAPFSGNQSVKQIHTYFMSAQYGFSYMHKSHLDQPILIDHLIKASAHLNGTRLRPKLGEREREREK